jgi:hypothetical protein
MFIPNKYPCPCCGYLVFYAEPGSHHLCPICQWEDNLVQLRFPRMSGAANTVSLEIAQKNYREFGAAERRKINLGREPFETECRDEGWRPLDTNLDNVEEPQRGLDYADSYPETNFTVLYYWRPTYWRRLSS